MAQGHSRYWVAMARGLAAVVAIWIGAGAGVSPARAGEGSERKISRDLARTLTDPKAPQVRWARDVSQARQVQVVVTATADADLSDLRQFVRRGGGTLHATMRGLRMITATVPAARVAALAARRDVQSVAPNRITRRTASTLELATGALASNVRPYSTKYSWQGLDGAGVGIAVLDSGVMKAHETFLASSGASRVRRNVQMLSTTLSSWTGSADAGATLKPGSAALAEYEAAVAADSVITQDPYGHGTHVAATAAGRAATFDYAGDSTGMAPAADVYDVRVLDANGVGTLSDALEGIQWVIYHAREYNIRVLNLSLAASSTDSWQHDPLCNAVRSAVAAGITVVVAAGNFGRDASNRETFGTISSPGNDPSVITVGAANHRGTGTRGDDTLTGFSSRGPTRGGWTDANGTRHVDNLIKPDLVAPGNRIVSAAATRARASDPVWNAIAQQYYADLVQPLGMVQVYRESQMMMSGTSVAAPVVAGAVALLLQANPGLTPPLVKAILQYTAQPLSGAGLLQQGAGMLNVSGAVAMARALRTDIAQAIAAGTLMPGDSLLAPGQVLPAPTSTLGGVSFDWSRVVVVGGHHLVSGAPLFAQHQPLWDPRLAWAGSAVRRREAVYWAGSGITPQTWVQGYVDTVPLQQPLLTAGVVQADLLAGPTSRNGASGLFLPVATLARALRDGGGRVLKQSIVLAESLVLADSIVLAESLVLSESIVMAESIVLAESLVLAESVVESESHVLGEP